MKGQGRNSNIFKACYFKNGSRYRLGYNGAPIGNGMCSVEWSRDRWRHVTVNGQGRDPNIFKARYFENGLR